MAISRTQKHIRKYNKSNSNSMSNNNNNNNNNNTNNSKKNNNNDNHNNITDTTTISNYQDESKNMTNPDIASQCISVCAMLRVSQINVFLFPHPNQVSKTQRPPKVEDGIIAGGKRTRSHRKVLTTRCPP